jgi:hypothetical protein
MVRVAGLSALTAAVAVVTAAYWDILESFLWHSPGLLGRIDYLTTATSRVWLVSGNPALLVSIAVVGATLFFAGAFVGVFREPVRK